MPNIVISWLFFQPKTFNECELSEAETSDSGCTDLWLKCKLWKCIQHILCICWCVHCASQ